MSLLRELHCRHTTEALVTLLILVSVALVACGSPREDQPNSQVCEIATIEFVSAEMALTHAYEALYAAGEDHLEEEREAANARVEALLAESRMRSACGW